MKVDINIYVNLEEIKEILTNADQLQKFVETSIEDLRSWVMNLNEYGRDYGTPSGEEPKQQAPARGNQDQNKSEAARGKGKSPQGKGEAAQGKGKADQAKGEAAQDKGEVNPEKGDAAPSTEISLEVVRAKLAALMQSGKQAEVKALLQKHSGEKLSDIPEDNYPALLKEAEAI